MSVTPGGSPRCHPRTHGHPPHPPVLEILELIQRRDLVAADEQIIALEAECVPASPAASPSTSQTGRQARDVALLYEALLAQLWAVVAESVPAGCPYAPLRAVIRVLQQEEQADRSGGAARPRGLRRAWQDAVARAAAERLAQVAAGPGLGERLAALSGRLLGDMGTVRRHLAPMYPPEFGAFGVYARGYQRALALQVAALAQRPLDVPELYLLLDWQCNTYPR